MKRLNLFITLFFIFSVTGELDVFASSHREAPIIALDEKADITDFYVFVSYDGDQVPGEQPENITFIMNVDPLLEPANGPTTFPFDPDILYEIKIDNNQDANPDIVFQVRFSTEFQLPNVFTALAGFGDNGASDPARNRNPAGASTDPQL